MKRDQTQRLVITVLTLNTLILVQAKVKMAVAWITWLASSPISPKEAAKYAIKSENSLTWPSLKPTSQLVERSSLRPLSKNLKTVGLMSMDKIARTKAGQITSPSKSKLKLAPIEKKNRMRKKSLSGFKCVAMYCEIGEVASATPATNAPISADKPRTSAAVASERHQPIDKRNIYS